MLRAAVVLPEYPVESAGGGIASFFSPARLPRKPFCIDDYSTGPALVRPLAMALKRRHIQPNHPAICWRLVFDLDRPRNANARQWWSPLHIHEDAGLPPPNWVSINPKSGNAHAGYELEIPVSNSSNMKAARYLDAIRQVYGKRLGADPAFNGRLCKNPAHPHWDTHMLRMELYSLDELAEHVDLVGVGHPRARGGRAANDDSDVFANGRNCGLFEVCRHEAYSMVRDYWQAGGLDGWIEAFTSHMQRRNEELLTHQRLDYAEVKGIAKSIAKWTWNNTSPAGLRTLVDATHTPEKQRARGVKSGESRRRGSREEAQPWVQEGISRATWYRRHRRSES